MIVAVYDVSTVTTLIRKNFLTINVDQQASIHATDSLRRQEKPKRPFWSVFGLQGSKKGQKRVFGQKETAVVSGFFDVFAFFGKP